MPQVEMYYRDMCPFCMRADQLLASKPIDVKRVNIWEEPGARDEMIQRANGKTSVPQIFIDGQHIGGCDDMMMLERTGKLDQMLQLKAA